MSKFGDMEVIAGELTEEQMDAVVEGEMDMIHFTRAEFIEYTKAFMRIAMSETHRLETVPLPESGGVVTVEGDENSCVIRHYLNEEEDES